VDEIEAIARRMTQSVKLDDHQRIARPDELQNEADPLLPFLDPSGAFSARMMEHPSARKPSS